MASMATSGARRKPQKYPEELRERAVRMELEIWKDTGERHGVITRVAREFGVGTESLRGSVNQAEVDAGGRPGTSSADALRIAELEREVRELRGRTTSSTQGGYSLLKPREEAAWQQERVMGGAT